MSDFADVVKELKQTNSKLDKMVKDADPSGPVMAGEVEDKREEELYVWSTAKIFMSWRTSSVCLWAAAVVPLYPRCTAVRTLPLLALYRIFSLPITITPEASNNESLATVIAVSEVLIPSESFKVVEAASATLEAIT